MVNENIDIFSVNGLEYKVYAGAQITSLPQLFQEGYRLLSIAELMDLRLEVLHPETDSVVTNLVWERAYNCADLRLTLPQLGRKIVPADGRVQQYLRENFNEAHWDYDAFSPALPTEFSTASEGLIVSRKKSERISNSEYDPKKDRSIITPASTKNNPIWRVLALNQTRLDKYVDATLDRYAAVGGDANGDMRTGSAIYFNNSDYPSVGLINMDAVGQINWSLYCSELSCHFAATPDKNYLLGVRERK